MQTIILPPSTQILLLGAIALGITKLRITANVRIPSGVIQSIIMHGDAAQEIQL
jgi:hypothetical protein